MILYDVTLRGASMSELDDAIIIRDIEEMPPTEDRLDSKRALHAGTRVTSIVRRTLPVKIVFVIREYDSTKRAAIMDKIAEWVGAGGEMTVSTRPGKRLFVKPEKTPRLGSSLKWTEDLELTLTAYEQPFWEDVDMVSVSATAAWSDSHQMYYAANVIAPTGNVDKVPLTLTVVNNGDDVLTHLKIVAGDTFFEFENLAVESGLIFGFVQVEYDENDVLSIEDIMAGVSLMANRTAESSDDLLVTPGKDNQLHVYADMPCKVQFNVRGRWL